MGQLRELAKKNPPTGVNKYLIDLLNERETWNLPLVFCDKEKENGN